MFSMGMGFGLWLGICAALQFPIQRAEPGKWKRDMGLKSGDDKAASVVLASRLFPSASLFRTSRCTVGSDGRAEALLIAEWGRRSLVGRS